MIRIARVAVAGLAVLLGTVSWACGKPAVIVTVDVESYEGFSLPEQVNASCEGGVPCGLMEIAGMLKERGLAGTFFVNVYEHRRWGQDAMRTIVADLVALGQDVALHPHPQWAYDAARTGLWQYSLDEQVAIIRDGVRLLSDWTGLPVVAHRAGDYSADANTLLALERNGVRIDSSLFWGNPRSRLNGLGMPRNLPSERGSVTEIPVTVFHREEHSRLLGGFLGGLNRVSKIDPDWFIDTEEARGAMDAVVAADLPYLVIFLHSFSLVSRRNGGPPEANLRTRENFRTVLDEVRRRGLSVVTLRTLAERGDLSSRSDAEDVVPRVVVNVGLGRYLRHRLRADPGRVLFGGAMLLVPIAGLAGLLWVRRRRSARGARGGCRSCNVAPGPPA